MRCNLGRSQDAGSASFLFVNKKKNLKINLGTLRRSNTALGKWQLVYRARASVASQRSAGKCVFRRFRMQLLRYKSLELARLQKHFFLNRVNNKFCCCRR